MFAYVFTSVFQRGNLDEEWMSIVRGEMVWTFEHGDTSISTEIHLFIVSIVTRIMTLFAVAGILYNMYK